MKFTCVNPVTLELMVHDVRGAPADCVPPPATALESAGGLIFDSTGTKIALVHTGRKAEIKNAQGLSFTPPPVPDGGFGIM